MLPLVPYQGMLRPILMVLTYAAGAFVLHATRNKPCGRKILLAEFIVYCCFVVYATFLSRSVAETYSYRLQAFSSARAAFALDGSLWDMIRGDFSILRITSPQSLEGIIGNILLFIPMGYLLPQVKRLPWFKVVLIGAACSAAIEFGQLLTKLGMLDVDDFIFNTAGTLLGVLLNALRLFAHRRIKTAPTP